MPGEQLGTVTHEAALATGFPEGCPVIATANDKAAEGWAPASSTTPPV